MNDPRTGTRYDALYDALDALALARAAAPAHAPPAPPVLLEVGTFDGRRGAAMAAYWHARTGGRLDYWGFDLFEDMTRERSAAEFSKSTLPAGMAEVQARLAPHAGRIALVKGDTRHTLPAAALPPVDLCWLDGGHSLATVASDWAAVAKALAPAGVALLDDYYPDRADVGCRPLVDALAADPAWAVAVLPAEDAAPTGLRIRVARVTRP